MFVIHKILKNFKDSMTNNPIISSVGSSHPNQYSYEIHHEYLSGWENLWEKIILSKLEHYFPYRICSNLFKDSFIFGETTSSHFFRVTTSTRQLLFRISYFCWGAPFPEQLLLFPRITTFSEWNFCRVANSWV